MRKKVEKIFHALHKVDMRACYAKQKINLACPNLTLNFFMFIYCIFYEDTIRWPRKSALLSSKGMGTACSNSDQEASLSAGKNNGVVLVPCLRMEVCPYSYFWRCGYFWGPWVSFVMTDEFSVRVTKITSRIGISWTHSLPFYF